MPPTRIGAIFRTARLDMRIQRAQRHERDALARAGELVVRTGERRADIDFRVDPVTATRILDLHLKVDTFGQAIAESLAADRADYAAVSGWIRPLVITRGLCARAVLRHHRRHCRQHLRPLYETLGAATMAGLPGERSMLGVPAALTTAAQTAAAERQAASAERTTQLAPFQGAAVPPWISSIGREGKALTKTFARQLHEKLVPRVSALAGLAAGWWVANTYTDSHWRSAFRSLGIGSGGTRVVSSETFQAMSFWLPILSAALCAYLGNRLAFLIRRRYQRPPASSSS